MYRVTLCTFLILLCALSHVVVAMPLRRTVRIQDNLAPRPRKAAVASNVSTGLIWQGSIAGWERTVLGFDVPHRVGTFAANFTSEQYTSGTSGNVSAVANIAYTPGVDGDFAYPSIPYQNIHSPPPGVQFAKFSVPFVFTDHCNPEDKAPRAETSLSSVIQLSAGIASGGVDVALLHGVSANMHCDPAKQPAGESCNSNAIWPYRWGYNVSTITNSTGVFANVTVDIFRGWTPTNGGLKPFNYVLDYSLVVDIKHITGPAGSFFAPASTLVSRTQGLQNKTNAPIPFSVPGAPLNVSSVATGVMGFGFTLDNNSPKRGRYLESMKFGVNPGVTAVAGEVIGSVTAYVSAPLTVVASDVTTYMHVQPLLFTAGAVSSQSSVAGNICMSGTGFSCKRKGMKEQTEDSVPFST